MLVAYEEVKGATKLTLRGALTRMGRLFGVRISRQIGS